MIAIATIVAGALGATIRYLVVTATGRHRVARMPIGTALVNAVGSIGLGLSVGLDPGHDLAMVLAGGFAGLTTFSGWMLEVATGITDGFRVRQWLLALLLPVAVGVALLAAGVAVGRWLN